MIRFAALTPSLAQPGGAERTLLIQLRYSDPARMQGAGIVLMGRGGLDEALGREIIKHTTIHSDEPRGEVYWYRAPLVHRVHPTLNDAVKHVCQEADVLITWGALSLAGYTAGLSIPVICVAHSSVPNSTAISGITHLVAVSEAAKRYFVSSPGVAGMPITVVPNGVEVDRVCPRRGRAWQRAQWGVSATDKVLLYLGRQAIDKNPWPCVLALAWLPAHYKLIMVGNQAFTPGEPHPRLVELVAEHGLQDRVKFLPPSTYVGDILAGADCLLHLSIREADSLVVKEAFLAGLPVVHTRAGSIPEIEAEFGLMGFAVGFRAGPLGPESVDPGDVAEQVKIAVSSIWPAKHITDKMRVVAWENWTGSAMCARWADYLEGVVAG
jgi:glycosyltransferase involved in cell wall biosynthesis